MHSVCGTYLDRADGTLDSLCLYLLVGLTIIVPTSFSCISLIPRPSHMCAQRRVQWLSSNFLALEVHVPTCKLHNIMSLSCDLCTGLPFQDSVGIMEVALKLHGELQTVNWIGLPILMCSPSLFPDSAQPRNKVTRPSFGWAHVRIWARDYSCTYS